MRARYVFFGACLVSCLAVACGDDEDNVGPGKAGSSGSAGEAGDSGTGATGNVGQGGAGAGTGDGGVGGEAALGFTDFVHDLVENETTDDGTPASVNGRTFPDPTDDHGHYLVPATDFDDLF